MSVTVLVDVTVVVVVDTLVFMDVTEGRGEGGKVGGVGGVGRQTIV